MELPLEPLWSLAGIENEFRLNAGAVNAGPTSNFKRLVLAPTGLYRHQTKTPGSYPIGLDFDLDQGGVL